MKNCSLVFFLTLIVTINCSAQSKTMLEKQWQNIELKDIHIELPSIFLIPKGKYKELPRKIKKGKFYETLEITAESIVKDKKATIEIMTTISEKGDYKKLSNLKPLSNDDIESMNSLNKKEMNKQKDIYGNVTQYFPIKITVLNGIPFVQYGYKRQLPGKPVENVNVYYAYNDDRIHQVTFTYISADQAYWKSDFERIINSVVVTNIK